VKNIKTDISRPDPSITRKVLPAIMFIKEVFGQQAVETIVLMQYKCTFLLTYQ